MSNKVVGFSIKIDGQKELKEVSELFKALAENVDAANKSIKELNEQLGSKKALKGAKDLDKGLKKASGSADVMKDVLSTAFTGFEEGSKASQDLNASISTTGKSISELTARNKVLKKVLKDVDSSASVERQIYSATGLEKLRYRLLKPGYFESPDLIFAAADCVAKNLITSHGVSENQISITGYPRTDVLFNPNDALKAMYVKEGCNTVLYLPTFREHDESDKSLYELINSFSSRSEYLLLIKLHPATFLGGTLDLPSNVVLLDQSVDTYEMMALSDVLITDYSSVALDYLLLDRPIMYFCYDYAAYISNERGLYYDFNQVVGGPVIETSGALLAELDEVLLVGVDHYKAKRHTVTRKFNHVVSKTNCANTYAAIENF